MRIGLGSWLAILLAAPLAAQSPRVDFNRDVRPILSDACFHCHGPDKARRKADLHFDTAEGAKAALVPGRPGDSPLMQRVTSKDPAERMPPPGSGLHLTPAQIETLRAWIAQGAAYQDHWAFITPKRPSVPSVRKKAWVRNPIDAFILARLEQAGLAPSPEADRATLLRRAALDLTGLPPTPEQVSAFQADERPDAYERAVDALLASPRYGERMASRWLDAARYADSNGYQTDGERTMWRWRDWVIDAYNANLPFDRFTLEQLAGDLLPGATLEQKIATGFNRNHRGNSEGGVIPEEFAVEYVVDRVDTTSTVWLGLTAGCARCHDHKYDPISQRDFYRLFAFFNNVPERGKAIKYGNSPPYVKTPTREQQQRLKELGQQVAEREQRFDALEPRLRQEQAQWEATDEAARAGDWAPARGLEVHWPLDALDPKGATAGSTQQSLKALGNPLLATGRRGLTVNFDGKSGLAADDVGAFGFFDKFTLSTWVMPFRGGTLMSRMVDAEGGEGYEVALVQNKLYVRLIKRWLDDAIRVETEDRLPTGQWQHVAVSYDGSRLASGVKVYVDGQPMRLKVQLDDLNQSFATRQPFRIGAGGGPTSRFHGAMADVRIHNRVLAPLEIAAMAVPQTVGEIVRVPPDRRTAAQAARVKGFFVEHAASANVQAARTAMLEVRQELEAYDASLPTTMVMEEMATPRAAHVLIRGEYDKKGERVSAGVPAALPPLPPGAPANRLGLAQWLMAPDNPLTARVAVNRAWQMLFGAGLVRSVEDFGAQGEWPSHLDLLDWLAVEYREQGWDTKRLLKLMVTSATYRQSPRASAALLQRDPENRLLARGPRFRLPAAAIRDQALFVSGLLVEKLGGPSVRPYQPEGLVKELHGTEDYVQDHGPNLYRRSLYTFWRRTVAPPALTTFDAANRETCVVRESRTNTPLQALNLLNDVTYVEAARMLAQRTLREAGSGDEARVRAAFRRVLLRQPEAREVELLAEALAHHRRTFERDRAAARRLIQVGEAPAANGLDAVEVAAMTAVCNLLLNLDETITRE